MAYFCAVLFPTRWDLRLNWVSFWGFSYLLMYDLVCGLMSCANCYALASYRISSVIRRSFFLPKQFQKSRSVLQDGSRSLGLFRKGKTRIIAKFLRADLVIGSHSREGETPSYNWINTVNIIRWLLSDILGVAWNYMYVQSDGTTWRMLRLIYLHTITRRFWVQ